MVGYVILLALFLSVASFPFILGLIEEKRPSDQGPLFIDLDRRIREDEEAAELREKIKPAVELSIIARDGGMPFDLKGKRIRYHPDLGKFRLIYGNARLEPHQEVSELLIVLGDLKVGEGCKLHGGAYSTGRIILEKNCKASFLISDSDIFLGENCSVERWINAKGMAVLSRRCRVRKVTSGSTVKVSEGCMLGEVASKLGLETVSS